MFEITRSCSFRRISIDIAMRLDLPNYGIVEQIYFSPRIPVYQGVRAADQQPVIIQLLQNEFPGFSGLVQFRNQFTLATNLHLSIVQAYSLEPYHKGYALVMENFGEESLSEYLQGQ